jgi:fructokinase
MDENRICCFGEILWDLFPKGKKLGGAPFNVTTSLKRLGENVEFISRIGEDSLGDEILNQITNRGISTDFIQTDQSHPTGKVKVSLDSKGVAEYSIETNSAWDFIETNQNTLDMVSNSKAFVFGSLIARGASYHALKEFLKIASFSIFDLNLRPPYYSDHLLIELMGKAQMLKFNDEELYLIADLMNSPFHSMDQHIEFIAKETQTDVICVTKGMFGAVLYHKKKWFYNSGFKVKVSDTVGAGDSFLGTLIHGLVSNDGLQYSLDRACAMGALVAGSVGANPTISTDELSKFMGSTNLEST